MMVAAATASTVTAQSSPGFAESLRIEHKMLMEYMAEQTAEGLDLDLRECEKGIARDYRDPPRTTFFKRVRVRVPRSG